MLLVVETYNGHKPWSNQWWDFCDQLCTHCYCCCIALVGSLHNILLLHYHCIYVRLLYIYLLYTASESLTNTRAVVLETSHPCWLVLDYSLLTVTLWVCYTLTTSLVFFSHVLTPSVLIHLRSQRAALHGHSCQLNYKLGYIRFPCIGCLCS